ncbi:MarR family transcriptional regulator [Vicingaceae bacterium]|jgi:DNA-binding MarR family transcriptional regulator|nr:MarR family transcriptional regulator [Vicingaceae bacterium]
MKQVFDQASISLTKEQFIVLCHLESGPQPQTSLAMITERDKGSLTRLVQTLERKNYVIKKSSKNDNRVNFVEITQLGNSILQKTKPIVNQVFNDVEQQISPEELTIAISVLEKIQQNTLKIIEQKEINV